MPDFVDELMTKRAGSVKGDRLIKVAKAPASWDGAKRSADFVMSSKAEDRDGDIIHSSGIDTTEFQKNPVALLFHKSRDFPIGTWSNLQKSDSQLDGTVNFLKEGTTPEADTAAKLVEQGVLRACSIGFIPKTVNRRTLENGQPAWSYEILEAELIECSIVPVPAHPAALVKAAAGDQVLARELIEDVLDNWAKTHDGLLVPRSEYERIYQTVKAGGDKTTVTVNLAVGEGAKAPIADQIRDALKAYDAKHFANITINAVDAKPPEPKAPEGPSLAERIKAGVKDLLGLAKDAKPEDKPGITPEIEKQLEKAVAEAVEPSEHDKAAAVARAKAIAVRARPKSKDPVEA